MKCPYCGQEHPDNAKFCMETGQRLMPQNRACHNAGCPDFGKYILPLEAKFCPICGAKLESIKDSVKTQDECKEAQDIKAETNHEVKVETKLEAKAEKPVEIKSEESTIAVKVSMKPEIISGEKHPDKFNFSINGVSFNMILVEHGTFTMGDTEDQQMPKSLFSSFWGGNKDYNEDARPIHKVTLTKDFYISEFVVTSDLWRAFMKCEPQCLFRLKYNRYPVPVAWADCMDFIRSLNTLLSSRLNGWSFRLPTEAEWEFAARGGNKSLGYRYSGSDDLYDVGRYGRDINALPNKVGEKDPNELGLYDMSGNVAEWCEDWYGPYSSEHQTDPKGPVSGKGKVVRGGEWFSPDYSCRSSSRNYRCVQYDGETSGIRLVLSK